ncbi:anthranilate phosphoribosyltransferase/anthranilate synthase/phosphoribosyltransferase [Lentibacillus persicus]|uniref:Anthranilate phosphoribosyltransferase n=1 Tax=Lentibacillus persicus TaxID=640948 RepID=A0A1I1YDD3_9BACI|nr:anthranilate phosphoribosyltransferase [Lentibacillus persicus]SFE15930.1 anthranilate phosphoribosyltransferase/anthranilate synthase/phosphoribosyltransferase [Lentibacillus persicus]
MKNYLEKLLNRESLTLEEMKDAAETSFNEHVTESELAAFLAGLRSKGETPEEIAGLADVIRTQSSQTTDELANVMDNCGTGGDGSNSFNISTTAAFVLAGAGVKVAKHGNRSISSKTGSADVLEHLGISLSFSKAHVHEMIQENNIAFLYAPHVHPGMKRFMTVRKNLGIPTIFNLIGPLTNPVNLDSQLLGAYRRDMLPVLAETLHQLGRKRALVINGAGYMDEASLAGENHISLMEEGNVTSFTLHPSEVNLPVYANEEIRGGNAKDNAAILLDVLNGNRGAHYDTVLLNAGLGLFANGTAKSINDGVRLAEESIQSGAAKEKLQRLVDYSGKMKSEAI